MSAIPMNTTGMRNSRLASEIMYASPLCAPTNLAATATAQESASATLSPVKICGSAPGNTIRKNVCALVSPSDSAARRQAMGKVAAPACAFACT
jgi:hypothetical protein